MKKVVIIVVSNPVESVFPKRLLFAKSDVHLERLLYTVYMFSNDICFTFGLNKYAKSSVVRGKVISSDDVPLSNDCYTCIGDW